GEVAGAGRELVVRRRAECELPVGGDDAFGEGAPDGGLAAVDDRQDAVEAGAGGVAQRGVGVADVCEGLEAAGGAGGVDVLAGVVGDGGWDSEDLRFGLVANLRALAMVDGDEVAEVDAGGFDEGVPRLGLVEQVEVGLCFVAGGEGASAEFAVDAGLLLVAVAGGAAGVAVAAGSAAGAAVAAGGGSVRRE